MLKKLRILFTATEIGLQVIKLAIILGVMTVNPTLVFFLDIVLQLCTICKTIAECIPDDDQ